MYCSYCVPTACHIETHLYYQTEETYSYFNGNFKMKVSIISTLL